MRIPRLGDIQKLCRQSQQFTALSKEIRSRLLKEHVTHIYTDIVGTSKLDDPDLVALGFAPDILRSFDRLDDAKSFRYTPAAPGFQLLPESAQLPVKNFRLQIPESGDSVAIGLKLLRDLLLKLNSSVALTVMVKPGVNRRLMNDLIRMWGAEPARVNLIEHSCQTLFAQDNGKAGVLANGTTALMLPRPSEGTRTGDDLSPDKLSSLLSLPVFTSKLYWEGGNVLYDGRICLIGANTIAFNMTRLGLSGKQVEKAFELEFGVRVLVIGNLKIANKVAARADDEKHNTHPSESGQADFHIDLDLCMLGQVGRNHRSVAAVADPLLGAEYLTALFRLQGLFEHHFLGAKDMKHFFRQILETTIERRVPLLETYKKTLTEIGFTLVSVPDIRLAPELNYLARVNMSFNYCNVLPAADHGGQPAIYLFHYGIPTLDKAADHAYRKCGVKPVPISTDLSTAHELLLLRGGLHCLSAKMG